MIDTQSNDYYDVIVVGGGPAGTTAATLLCRRGYRCLVLEGSKFPRYHIGESLIPHTHGTFERLGLLPKLRESGFPVKHSVRFVSPSGKDTTPFYFSETIEGERSRTWQVERSEFDQLCMNNAIESGAEYRSKTRVSKVLFENGRATGVRVQAKSGASQDILSRVVVDASGRAAVIGNQLGFKENVPGLDKASIWTYYEGGHRGDGIDAGETTIFMIQDRGWFWYIPLPRDYVSVGVVADPKYLFRDSQQYDDIFAPEVELCQPLRKWLQDANPVGPVRGIRRLAYLNRQVAGNGWVMIGDSAGFLDPIYSSGLFLALSAGELAADCIHEGLSQDDLTAQRLGAFVRPLWEGIEVIYRLIRAFYDPVFSFQRFAEQFPEQRAALIDCLIGDVVGKDMHSFLECLATMSPPPPKLHPTEDALLA